MDQTDTTAGSEPSVDTVRAVARGGREYVSKAAPYLRRGVDSGAVTAVVGGAGLFSGLRALLGGERGRALTRLAVGAAFVAATVVQRRSRGRDEEPEVGEPEAVDTGPEVEGPATVDNEADDGDEEDRAGRAAAEAADASPDVTGDESTTAEEGADDDTRTGDEDTDTEIERLGGAALDGQSREVPAPQRAFNRGFLAHSAEAFWGIRTRDDAVLVSQDYDAVQGRDGVQYVASSQIGEDSRELPIPDAVLNHWNDVLGGGTAVAGGDDVLFVTTDDLAADGLLRVLPAEWADDLSE